MEDFSCPPHPRARCSGAITMTLFGDSSALWPERAPSVNKNGPWVINEGKAAWRAKKQSRMKGCGWSLQSQASGSLDYVPL